MTITKKGVIMKATGADAVVNTFKGEAEFHTNIWRGIPSNVLSEINEDQAGFVRIEDLNLTDRERNKKLKQTYFMFEWIITFLLGFWIIQGFLSFRFDHSTADLVARFIGDAVTSVPIILFAGIYSIVNFNYYNGHKTSFNAWLKNGVFSVKKEV